MAAEGGLGPSIPPRPAAIRPAIDNAGDEVDSGVPPRPVPTRLPPRPPTRPAPASPQPHPREAPGTHGSGDVNIPLEPPIPPRPQQPSVKASAKSKGRPVITVVDARPMNQVGFRDSDPAPTKDGKRAKPEITVVAARPMSEVGFRSDKPSPVPSPTTAPRGEHGPSSRPSSQDEISLVMMRHKSRGPAPPRPSSMPVKPPPPTRVSSIRQQPANSQNTKTSFQYDRVRVPGMQVETSVDEAHRPPGMPPRPVSRPQSLQFTNEGADLNTPSGSSGYGSELTTSESHQSLSSDGSPAGPPAPQRKKPMGVQVLPMGPEMLKRISSRGGEQNAAQDDEQGGTAPSRPVPSPRAARKGLAPPSPQPRERKSASPAPSPTPTPTESIPMTDVDAHSGQATDTHPPDRHHHGVMVLPPMPKPRAPSPQPPAPIEAVTPTSETFPQIKIDPRILAEFGPESAVDKTDENQNKQDTNAGQNQEQVEDIVLSDMCVSPPPTKPRPAVKPKPGVKPKPSVAAKPKPLAKPPRQIPDKPVEGPQVQSPPANRLYPMLPTPSEDDGEAPVSPGLQVNIQSPDLKTSPQVSPRAMLVDHISVQGVPPRPASPARRSPQVPQRKEEPPLSPDLTVKVETSEVKTSPHVSPRATLVEHTTAQSPPPRPQSPEKQVFVHKSPPKVPERKETTTLSSDLTVKVETTEVNSSPHVSPRAMLVEHTLAQSPPPRPQSPEKQAFAHKSPPKVPERKETTTLSSDLTVKVETTEVKTSPHVSPRAMLVEHTVAQSPTPRPTSSEVIVSPGHTQSLEIESKSEMSEIKTSLHVSPRTMLVDHAVVETKVEPEYDQSQTPPKAQNQEPQSQGFITGDKPSPIVSPRSMLVQHAVSQGEPQAPPRPQSPEKKLQPTVSGEEKIKVEDTQGDSSTYADATAPSKEKKLYPTLPQPQPEAPSKKVFPVLSPTEQKASDSFYDDFDDNGPPNDPFYNRKNGRDVVDESLFSLVVTKKEEEVTKEAHLKKYFSQSEIKERENKDPGVDFYRKHPEILTDGGPSPVKLKRPTIIRPKKAPPPSKQADSNGKEGLSDASGSSPEKPEPESVDKPKEEALQKEEALPKEEAPVVAPVVAKRPTIIRPQKLRPQSLCVSKTHSEPIPSPTEAVNAVRPKKPSAPPPVKPKPPTPVRVSASPLQSPLCPPKTKPKPAAPPPTKPKPKRPVSMGSALPDLATVDRTHPGSPTFAARKVHTTQQVTAVVKTQEESAPVTRTDSMSSFEENENMLNELKAKQTPTGRVRHASAGSSASSEGAAHEVERRHGGEEQQEEGKDKPPAVMRKSWVPPGAVRVMGVAPPPLPRTGPVAVSTPDLRIVPATEEPPVSPVKAPHATPRRSHSPPLSTEHKVTPPARPKSVSMIALNKPSFEQEAAVAAEGIREEKQPEQVQEKPTRPPPVRRPAPPRPAGGPSKDRPASVEVSSEHRVEAEPAERRAPPRPGPPPSPTARPKSTEGPPEEHTEPEPVQKRAPARPGPPPSPTAKKAPPRRAPPPQVSRPPQPSSPPRLPDRPGPGHPLYHYVVKGPHGIALFDYDTTAEDELRFKAGDVIELEEQISEEWMVGRNVEKRGMFPAAFVDVIEAPPVTGSKRAPSVQAGVPGTGPRCVARFDFDTGEEGDLSFSAGDVITLTERSGDEWLKGAVGGKEGLFPAEYVEIIEDLPPPGSPGKEPEVAAAGADENTVTAVYDFDGEEGDLSFKSGDKVKVLSKLNDDWLFGQIVGGATGTFPAGFVDRMPKDLPMHVPLSATAVEPAHDTTGPTDSGQHVEIKVDEPHCVADYDFVGKESGDLSFAKGDRIVLTGRVGSDWLKGTVGGRTGVFPKAYVTVVKDLEDPKPKEEVKEIQEPQKSHTPTPAPSGKAIAMYDFEGEAEGDLPLKIGDEVTLLEKIGADWYSGKVGENSGLFPAGFIKVVHPLTDTVPEPESSFV